MAYARRRYPSWYRRLPKRKRQAYRRAALRGHDYGVRWINRHVSPTARRKVRTRTTRRQRAWLSRKIRILRREGYKAKQAVAIAFSMLRKKKRRR